MTQDQWTQLVSVLIGAVGVVVWRLIDRFLPDSTGRHPTPPAGGVPVVSRDTRPGVGDVGDEDPPAT